MAINGIILKGIAGFYYVKTDSGVYECKARGKIKNKKITPLVGDNVKMNIEDEVTMKGVIEEILPRRNELLRPTVANVDQAIIVFAIHNPEPSMNLIDKLTVLSEYSNLEILLVFNKLDLDNDHHFRELEKVYRTTGYKVIATSTYSEDGIDELKECLRGKISVFAGPSGVGKSSLLNDIQSGLTLQTGELSEKIKRGKHTTRHSELVELDIEGWVVDTPGFTSLNIDFIDEDELGELYPEFEDASESCKFANCLHLNEPGCKVLEAIEIGEISKERYETYVYFINQIKEARRYKKW